MTWTSLAIWRNPSRWSRFLVTAPAEDAVCEFQVRIEAQHLGLNFIPEANQERHDIILSLYWHRYSPSEIAAYLNRLGIKTPRGKTYYGKLVEVFESETKDEIHSLKRSEEHHAQEASRLKKQLSQLEREIRTHGETLSRVKAEPLLKSQSPKEVAKIVKNIEEIVTGLAIKQEALVSKIKTHESNDDWDDWIYKHGQLLDHLIDLEPKDQLFVLNHVLKSIVVETIDTRSHRLTINFKLPYYGGRFDPINPKKPSKGATLTGGKDLIEVTLHNAKKNSAKRDS